MAKKKMSGSKSKRNLGGVARLEMKAKRPKENPFERRFGREKHKVLNRKSGMMGSGKEFATTSGAVGKPGQARARAQMKRRATLLPEYEKRNKAGKFMLLMLCQGWAPCGLGSLWITAVRL